MFTIGHSDGASEEVRVPSNAGQLGLGSYGKMGVVNLQLRRYRKMGMWNLIKNSTNNWRKKNDAIKCQNIGCIWQVWHNIKNINPALKKGLIGFLPQGSMFHSEEGILLGTKPLALSDQCDVIHITSACEEDFAEFLLRVILWAQMKAPWEVMKCWLNLTYVTQYE